MSIESVMPSNHLILCCPFLLPPSIFPSSRVFSSESVLGIGGQNMLALFYTFRLMSAESVMPSTGLLVSIGDHACGPPGP